MEHELHALRMRIYQAEALAARSDAVIEAARKLLEHPSDGHVLENLRTAMSEFDAARARLRTLYPARPGQDF